MQEYGVKTVKKADIANNATDRAATRSLLPLVAIGSGLAATPASALELGDLTVQSNLGQPLRASIAYALAPNEMLSDTCVSVSPGRSTSGLPGIGSNSIRITERAILIAGTSAIREPMMATRVTINCPYTPNLSREYMLLVDPVGMTTTSAVAEAPAETVATVTATAPATAAEQTVRVVDNTPIGQSTRYQVKIGETLGDIARRIENRSMSLWPAVDLIFQANPDAFIDSDPNKLKAGAWLTIPSLDGSSAPVVTADAAAPAATATASTAPVEIEAAGGTAYEPPIVDAMPETAPVEPVAAETLTDTTADLRPGDVIVDSENPFVESSDSSTPTVVIPDTELEAPQATSSSPNVPTAIISTGSRSESTSLLAWLIGGGLAVIVALLLFGRRIRERFGSTPIAPVAAHPQRRASDQTAQVEALVDEDYDLEDDSPTEENLALDADLVMGTGFDDGSGMEVAEDIGFPTPTEVDIELPFEPEPAAEIETDIIPPVRADIGSILESEVLPDDEDYDMSVIMDATKMPQHEDVTKHDLKAVEVGAEEETRITDNYTISKEVDYDILEQDYEEELSATQALNQEIARAAAELADDLDEAGDDEITTEMPLASVTELDVTATLEQPDDDTAEMTAEMEQSRDPAESGAVTVNMSADDKTAEMAVAGNDDTVEMDVEGGKVDTKAS